MFSMKRNCWREGVLALPLPGCGSFVEAEVGDLILLVWSVAALLKCGITLSDYKAFFDTQKGVGFLTQEARCVCLPQDCLVWVPWGDFAHVVFFQETIVRRNRGVGVFLAW